MTKNRLNLFFSLLASFCIHATAIGFVVYSNFNDEDTNISQNKDEKVAFGIEFTQIADKNTNQEAASKTSEISNFSEELVPPVQEIIEHTEVEMPEMPDKIEPIAKEFDKEQFAKPEKPKPKKKKVVKKPKKIVHESIKKEVKQEHVCEHCIKHEKIIEDITKKALEAANAGSNMQASNDANIIGGNKSSGSATAVQDGGSNLIGEIYAALKKHMTYPKKALVRQIEGRVVVEFKLLDNGSFEYINVVQSSGSKILDNHAVHIVNLAKKSLPKDAVGLSIKVPIVFDIEQIKGDL